MKLERFSGLSEQEINGHLERSHVEREVGRSLGCGKCIYQSGINPTGKRITVRRPVGEYRGGFKMKMNVERSRIVILPENEQDKAYIEDTLGFKEEKEAIPCKRVALMGAPRSIAYLEIRGMKENKE